MSKIFKYFRITLATVLPAYLLLRFAEDLSFQSKGGLDGPLAHHVSYAISLNKILYALLLSAILLFDVTLKLPSWGKSFFKFGSALCVILSLIGFVYIIREHSGFIINFGFKETNSFIELYLFQAAYLLTSLVFFGKSISTQWSNMNYTEKPDA